MTQDTTFIEKFAQLKKWTPHIIETVRKDLKNDHLKKDPLFLKQFLKGKPLNKITNEDLTEAYMRVLETNEQVGEFITNRWLLKYSDVYYHFEKALLALNPDITKITHIDDKVAEGILAGSVEQFGAIPTYLFSRLNSVAFSEPTFNKLEKQAEKEVGQKKSEETFADLESIKGHYEQQIARLEDRYEKKLSSMERKYHQDTETLKKQIGNLQRKIAV